MDGTDYAGPPRGRAFPLQLSTTGREVDGYPSRDPNTLTFVKARISDDDGTKVDWLICDEWTFETPISQYATLLRAFQTIQEFSYVSPARRTEDLLHTLDEVKSELQDQLVDINSQVTDLHSQVTGLTIDVNDLKGSRRLSGSRAAALT